MGYVNVDFGVGAYSEGPWVYGDDRFAYTIGSTNLYPAQTSITSNQTVLPSPYTATAPLIKKFWQTSDNTIPQDTSQYGYAFWFRYT